MASRHILPLTTCSDARDKIYATFGFAHEWQPMDRNSIPIDYTLTTDELFCRATKYLLATSQTLDMLPAAKNREPMKQDLGLPSWCPDYDAGMVPMLKGDPAESGYLWTASGSSSFTASQDDIPLPLLRVYGMMCGAIETCMEARSQLHQLSATSELLRWLLRIKNQCYDTDST